MIVIIDYGMGNVGSIQNMLRKIGAEAVISPDTAVISTASKLILPGVGAFDNGMKNLHDSGILPVLEKKVMQYKTPVLGICLGMQLFSKKSEEGTRDGLGWIDAQTVIFRFEDSTIRLKIPHMGWNHIKPAKPNPIFDEMDESSRFFYFVHSYHVVCNKPEDILATTVYGYEFVSAVNRGNIYGVQFHPEKSHKFGMKLLKNFVERA